MFQYLRILLFIVGFTAVTTQSHAQAERTQNQEQGWVQVPSGTATEWLPEISAPTGRKLWVSGPDYIVASTDLGLTWHPQDFPVPGRVEFVDDSNGMLTKATQVFATTNGGNTWEPRSPLPTNTVFGFTYITRDTAFALGNGTVIRTTDQGRTWKAEDIGHPISIHFLNSKIGVVGCRSLNYGLIFRTTDGGERWTRHETPPHDWRVTHAISRDSVFLASVDGYATLSTNAGANWLFDTLITDAGFGIGSFDQRGQEGWGAGGQVRYTQDFEHWDIQQTPVSSRLYDIEIVNDSIILASGEKGVILRTSNKGKSWVQVHPALIAIPSQSYPEPIAQSGMLRYSLPEAGVVTIVIHTMEGSVQSHLFQGFQQLGTHELPLEVSSWPSGVYLYTIEAAGNSAQGRITVIH